MDKTKYVEPGFEAFVRAFDWAHGVGQEMARGGRVDPVIYLLNTRPDAVSTCGSIKITAPTNGLKAHEQALEIAADLEGVDIAVYLRRDLDAIGHPVLTIHLMSSDRELSTINGIDALTRTVYRGFIGPELLQQREIVRTCH
mgnify:CR=1 FL=1